MIRDDIAAVIEKFPELYAHGLGRLADPKLTPAEREEEAKKSREDLLGSADICSLVCEWLADKPSRETIDNHHSSYGIKHIFSVETGEYVTNGAFIAAAVHYGLKVKRCGPESPNVSLNLKAIELIQPVDEDARRAKWWASHRYAEKFVKVATS